MNLLNNELNHFVNHGSDDAILKSMAGNPMYEGEELQKALKKEGLVQVQVTVNGKNGTYTRMQWKKASDVDPKTDKVVSNGGLSLKERSMLKDSDKGYVAEYNGVKIDCRQKPISSHKVSKEKDGTIWEEQFKGKDGNIYKVTRKYHNDKPLAGPSILKVEKGDANDTDTSDLDKNRKMPGSDEKNKTNEKTGEDSEFYNDRPGYASVIRNATKSTGLNLI